QSGGTTASDARCRGRADARSRALHLEPRTGRTRLVRIPDRVVRRFGRRGVRRRPPIGRVRGQPRVPVRGRRHRAGLESRQRVRRDAPQAPNVVRGAPRRPMTPENLLTEWARLLVESLADAGVREVVLSPGSRSTPVAAAALACVRLVTTSVVDERAAGFY